MSIAEKVLVIVLLSIGDGGLLYFGIMKGKAASEQLASYVTGNEGVRD